VAPKGVETNRDVIHGLFLSIPNSAFRIKHAVILDGIDRWNGPARRPDDSAHSQDDKGYNERILPNGPNERTC
jgi:hypothetical protein